MVFEDGVLVIVEQDILDRPIEAEIGVVRTEGSKQDDAVVPFVHAGEDVGMVVVDDREIAELEQVPDPRRFAKFYRFFREIEDRIRILAFVFSIDAF